MKRNVLGVGDQMLEDLVGWLEVENFPQPVIEAFGDLVQLVLGEGWQVDCLIEVLVDQAGGVFAAAALRWAIDYGLCGRPRSGPIAAHATHPPARQGLVARARVTAPRRGAMAAARARGRTRSAVSRSGWHNVRADDGRTAAHCASRPTSRAAPVRPG